MLKIYLLKRVNDLASGRSQRGPTLPTIHWTSERVWEDSAPWSSAASASQSSSQAFYKVCLCLFTALSEFRVQVLTHPVWLCKLFLMFASLMGIGPGMSTRMDRRAATLRTFRGIALQLPRAQRDPKDSLFLSNEGLFQWTQRLKRGKLKGLRAHTIKATSVCRDFDIDRTIGI